MTASAPEAASAAAASSQLAISPFTTTRNREFVLDRANRGPVRTALVELAAGAPMHGDEAHARLLGAARQFRRVDRAIIPAEPHLERDRHRDRADRGFDQRQRVIEIAHQRRAGLAAGHVPRRTTHVDVDDVGASRFGDPRRLPPSSALRSRQVVRRAVRGPAPSARSIARGSASARSWLAVISETTRPAPIRATRRRTGASVTPDIGARMTWFGSAILPTAIPEGRKVVADKAT